MTKMGPDSSDHILQDNQVLSPKGFDWLNAIQFGFSLSGALLYLGVALFSAGISLLGGITQTQILPESQLLSSYLFSAGLGFAGLLMIPSIIYSGRVLFGKQTSTSNLFKWLGYGSGIFPVLIFVGYIAQTGPSWAKLFLPVLHPLANAAVIFWTVHLVYRRIGPGSPRRFWGSFGSGLTIIPVIAFVFELLILFVLGIFWVVVISSQSELSQELFDLVGQLQNDNLNPELIESFTTKLITQPGIAASAILYISILVPVIEEFLKPAVLWLTLGRKFTPQEGFLVGAASGAGYALFENLTIGAAADVWALVTITRIGTAAIHIITSALVGWGITSAISNKKYGRFLGALLTAIILHGVWNGLNILTALLDIPSSEAVLSGFAAGLAEYAPVGLVLLALGSFVGLIRANSWLQRAIIAESTEKSEV
jgi:hypothetical protein